MPNMPSQELEARLAAQSKRSSLAQLAESDGRGQRQFPDTHPNRNICEPDAQRRSWRSRTSEVAGGDEDLAASAPALYFISDDKRFPVALPLLLEYLGCFLFPPHRRKE